MSRDIYFTRRQINSSTQFGARTMKLPVFDNWAMLLSTDRGVSGTIHELAIGPNDVPFHSVSTGVQERWKEITHIGKTYKSDAEVETLGKGLLSTEDKYHFVQNNCQTFFNSLTQMILHNGGASAPHTSLKQLDEMPKWEREQELKTIKQKAWADVKEIWTRGWNGKIWE